MHQPSLPPVNRSRARRSRRAALAFALAGALLLAAATDAQTRWSLAEEEPAGGVIIRLLPPASGFGGGKVLIETLLSDPEVHNVLFFVDGELVERRRAPPWTATLHLAAPPREQLVRAEARDADDRLLGADELLVNRRPQRLRIALRALEPTAGELTVRAEVTVPDAVELERLELYFNDELRRSYAAAALAAGALDGAAFADGMLEVTLEVADPDPQAFVRVVAHLADGRAVEDVGLVSGREFTEEVDVRLVQLQVVVTNKRGLPMRGLQKQHFRISENGRERQPAGLFPADDVTLLLGLALDSSGSMERIWPQARHAASTFITGTMLERDQGFLVDFDTRLRLLQKPTGDRAELLAALDGLEPEGGTALYDSILFSLLQFDGRQGRRALVVLTDGYDIDSQADPRRAIEFGLRLGVPIYILALDSQGGGRVPSRGISRSIGDAGAAIQELHLLTDPTGGRLYRVGSPDQISRAFTLINAELRNQYVLTYYTDTPPEPGRPPRVEIDAPEHPNLRAKVVFGTDQVY